MTYVVTLVSDPGFPSLTEDFIRRAAEVLPHAGEAQWLGKGVAADIPFTPDEPADLRALWTAVRAALGPAALDVILQPVEGRRKKLLLADMDSTIIRQECVDELAAEIGKKPQVAAITERAMRGEIAFEPALRERVALFKGLHPHTIPRVLSKKISLTPGARVLVQTMRAHGAHTALVSGGFTLFAAPVAEKVGFDHVQANELLLGEDGRFSGLLAEPVLGERAKLETLLALREGRGLGPSETLAVGDGANDIPMLREAGLGIAFRGKPAVAEAAQARIDHADLTALLYAQGYRQEEFFAEARAQLNPSDWKRKYGAMEKAHERTRL
ncbi:phosphoserine phosphatase SerB [Methylocapsa acidiphila]|uniref:phosphoserine phosphatase SerB n=1 Tax=Methylocapsa acidiphila TaxID=133552 RepID=UPI0004287E1F|nr:phosphoserine phosphatase SerB [Methylocapsa acidiphila]